MASLRQFPGSPCFYACFTDATGRRLQRTTKQTNRKKAQTLADKWEYAAKLAAEKRLGEAQSRRIISEIYETLNGEPLPSSTASEYLNGWVIRRTADTSPATSKAYAQIVRNFITSLGPRAAMDISQISKADVARYRDGVQKRTTIATANKSLKIIRVALGAAYKDGFIQDNPAAKLDTLKRKISEQNERRPFTLGELKNIVAKSNGEWKGIVLFGLYTGQRLKDIGRLTWNAIDMEKQELRFVTAKTGRRMSLHLHPRLIEELRKLPAGDDPNEPLFPASYKIAIKETGDSRLSQQFHGILFAAGLSEERSKDATGNGRALPRKISTISFHSLRHTATSLLKNAGVSEAVAMDIIGHATTAMSRHYTHIEDSSKRDALNKLPHIV